MVLLNGKLIAPTQLKDKNDLNGFGFWKLKDSTLSLNNSELTGATLDLVVENMGRMSLGTYFQYNQTFKGLWQGIFFYILSMGFCRSEAEEAMHVLCECRALLAGRAAAFGDLPQEI